ncbi:MAG: hypothetical protein R2795_11935 [Saprospiraceae bacterium]
MDGIAIHYDGQAGLASLPIVGTVAAGAAQYTLADPATCVEIMTGAVLPVGADTVVRYEDIQIEDGKATIQVPIKQG